LSCPANFVTKIYWRQQLQLGIQSASGRGGTANISRLVCYTDLWSETGTRLRNRNRVSYGEPSFKHEYPRFRNPVSLPRFLKTAPTTNYRFWSNSAAVANNSVWVRVCWEPEASHFNCTVWL